MKTDNIIELSSNITQGITEAIKKIDQTIENSEVRRAITALLGKARGDAEQIVEIIAENNNGSELKKLKKRLKELGVDANKN